MRIHIVQKGDTLWEIAQKYGVDFEQLKQMNTHLSNPDMIMPGMKIKVPTDGKAVKKKEAPITKEAPIAKEAPIMKEAPKAVHPYKDVSKKPKEVMGVKQEDQDEALMMQYNDGLDVNMYNQYMFNMPQYPMHQPTPHVKGAEVDEESPEFDEHTPAQLPYPGMLPQNCVPMTPILPGPGFHPPMHHVPMMPQGYPQMVNPAMTPGVPGVGGLPQYEELEESPDNIPEMPNFDAVGGAYAPMGNPYNPHDCGCGGPTPYGASQYPAPFGGLGYSQPYGGYPVPQQPIQGVVNPNFPMTSPYGPGVGPTYGNFPPAPYGPLGGGPSPYGVPGVPNSPGYGGVRPELDDDESI